LISILKKQTLIMAKDNKGNLPETSTEEPKKTKHRRTQGTIGGGYFNQEQIRGFQNQNDEIEDSKPKDPKPTTGTTKTLESETTKRDH
jgi:hypothetical protein